MHVIPTNIWEFFFVLIFICGSSFAALVMLVRYISDYIGDDNA